MSPSFRKAVLMGAAMAVITWGGPALSQESAHKDAVFAAAEALQPKVVAWRRDIHQHPELGNREFRTSALVADHLRALGYEVKTGVAHTGVVATLKGI